ncbi:hypothetical protein GCM10023153_26170 [Ornithinibacter aureus]|uniref:DUF4870 domain-containing protein n=1 Tax=Ornithinibacter aureus TaxID=622664 RepID=A0ABP8K370_9MICO|nr:DUF4870 domain-containing protein [Ornithinibacter aureus]KAF0832428.1 putative Tic20 family protein [Ornithinibacter aureus]
MSDTTPRTDDHPVDPTAPFEPVTDAAPTTEQTEVVPELPAPEHTEFVPAAPAPAPVAPSAHEAQPQAQAQPQYQQQSPPAPGYAVAPAPMKPTDERTAGMAAHGVTLAATIFSSGFLGFVCALVMYLVFRDRGPFVRSHAANALNVQIMAGIVMLISLPLMLVLVGFLTFGAAVIWAIVMHIIGAVKANNGEWWSPALTPQFVK